MRVFFDTEFIDDGRTIEMISIGLVREDGETLYLESADCDLGRASDWVKANVLPHLVGDPVCVPRSQIAEMVEEFAGEKPEFWAYYADYDWVALCQLYGTMMDLPKGWPMFCMDVQQWRHELGNPDMPQPADEHHALADARWTKDAWERLRVMRETRKAA